MCRPDADDSGGILAAVAGNTDRRQGNRRYGQKKRDRLAGLLVTTRTMMGGIRGSVGAVAGALTAIPSYARMLAGVRL
jgi:hypothetical protein